MCIIVAKPAGVKLPSKNIISTCFQNNPDGAGIMLASKGQVFGFKGLMTLEAVTDKLEQLEKRFGSLKKLPVVLHFRITTHGGSIAENTHPFPLKASYAALRDLEWIAPQGMAHNGIISATSYHPDIKAENVSDTMVFIKHIAAPIAKCVNIAANKQVASALQLAAGSKLAFLNGDGKLMVAGDFTHDGGIYYSNTSYKEARVKYVPKYYNYDYDDYYDTFKYGGWTTYSSYKDKKEDVQDQWSEDEYASELADEAGLIRLFDTYNLMELENNNCYEVDDQYAINCEDGSLYYWSSRYMAWLFDMRHDQYKLFDLNWQEVDLG